MSDHSAIQSIVKDSAINCKTGALFSAHAETSSTATSRLVTPRKRLQVVPVLDPNIGVAAIRDHFQKEVCHGNARAAKLLQRLIFRYLPEECGKARLRTYRYNSFWWEKSYEDWAMELDATVKQVRTDFAKLKEWGIAEARPLKVYEGKNAGKTVTHARVFVADGAASLSGWPDYSQMRIVLGCPNGHPIASPKWASHSIAQMGIHKAKEEVEKEKGKGSLTPVPTTTGTASTPVEFTKEEGKDPKPTPNNLPEKYLKLAVKWKLLYEEQYGTPFVMPTQETLKNFRDAMYEKVLKQAGINPDEFIECLFSHTAHFTHATGLNQRPDMKQVYLNIGVMVDQFFKVQKKKESDAKYDKQIAANIAAFDSKPVEAKPAEPVASMAEVLAGMAALDAIMKPAKPLETVDVSEVPERTTEGPLPLTEAQKEAALKNYLATTLANKGTPANYLFGN